MSKTRVLNLRACEPPLNPRPPHRIPEKASLWDWVNRQHITIIVNESQARTTLKKTHRHIRPNWSILKPVRFISKNSFLWAYITSRVHLRQMHFYMGTKFNCKILIIWQLCVWVLNIQQQNCNPFSPPLKRMFFNKVFLRAMLVFYKRTSS